MNVTLCDSVTVTSIVLALIALIIALTLLLKPRISRVTRRS